MLSAFRYSGNKSRLLKRYRSPPVGTERIVEPYLGSGAYVINSGLPGLGFDLSENVVDLWTWLQSTTPEQLEDLDVRLLLECDVRGKADIRKMGLTRGEMLYLKINVCGLMVGQWTSWGVYPQHKLPVKKTSAALPSIRKVQVVRGDPETLYEPRKGDMLFVDPPYDGTVGGYQREREYQPASTIRLLDRCRDIPTILTYGTSAPDIFPGLPWEVVAVRKVPGFRRGGSVERVEHVAYLNWPSEDR